jgi:hypothetical protein
MTQSDVTLNDDGIDLVKKSIYFQKDACKTHQISSWMVVNTFTEKEAELNEAIKNGQTKIISNKFDIILNDLNNGNTYKFRFHTLHLAKCWLEQFQLASTFYERMKPDNLIKFD